MDITEDNYVAGLQAKNEKALKFFIEHDGWIVKSIVHKMMAKYPVYDSAPDILQRLSARCEKTPFLRYICPHFSRLQGKYHSYIPPVYPDISPSFYVQWISQSIRRVQ